MSEAHPTSSDPYVALALAYAARETLIAEQTVAQLQAKECQQFLNILNNTIADAHTHVNKSTAQIHSILQILRQKGMPLESPAKLALNTDDNFLSDDESDIELPFDDESELTDNESYLDNRDPDLGL